ncbi:MAG: class II fructose-bisphosphatase [Deltaproteobacteria bacterium]|nr:class II fructose-bisphosphatase [Deltaproteobacteria bacterium]
MERNLALEAVRVTEAAALASARLMGLGSEHQATRVASEAIRRAFASIEICGTVVIGEGDRDDTPVLFVGEKLGRWEHKDPPVSLAINPLEGASSCAKGRNEAMAAIAMTNGSFLNVPDVFVERIAVGPAARGAIDLSASPKDNLQAVADAKGVYVEDLTIAILDHPRHERLIREVREAGARIRLVEGGELASAVATAKDGTGIDLAIGTGGAAEAVIAAAALRCLGGDMLARFALRSDREAEKLVASGLDPIRVYGLEDLASGDVVFAATGVTTGAMLDGVRFVRGGAVTSSMVMRSKTMTVRTITAHHRFDRKPDYS